MGCKSGDWYICIKEHYNSDYTQGDIIQTDKRCKRPRSHQWECSVIRLHTMDNYNGPWHATALLDERTLGGPNWEQVIDVEKLLIKLENGT